MDGLEIVDCRATVKGHFNEKRQKEVPLHIQGPEPKKNDSLVFPFLSHLKKHDNDQTNQNHADYT